MSGLDGGRALDEALSQLHGLTDGSPCEGPCGAYLYREDVDHVAAEVAGFRLDALAAEADRAEIASLRTALARAEATAERAVEALEAQGAVVERLNAENARLSADVLTPPEPGENFDKAPDDDEKPLAPSRLGTERGA